MWQLSDKLNIKPQWMGRETNVSIQGGMRGHQSVWWVWKRKFYKFFGLHGLNLNPIKQLWERKNEDQRCSRGSSWSNTNLKILNDDFSFNLSPLCKYSPRMEEDVSESCFCSETLDIILGIGSGVLQHTCTVALFPSRSQRICFCAESVNVIMIEGYLQHCRSFMSLKSPVSGSSLFSSLLISLLISLCWRSRASSLAVRSSQDLDRASGWPGVRPTWFNMPSEQDIRFRLRWRPR